MALAFPIGFFSSALALSAMWLLLFGDNPWPNYAGFLFLLSFILPFIIVLVGSMVMAYQYALRLEKNPNRDEVRTLSRRHFMLAVGACAVVTTCFMLCSHQRQIESDKIHRDITESQKIISEIPKIENLDVKSEGDELKITVQWKPPQENIYKLIILVRSKGYVNDILFKKEEPINSENGQGTFEVILPFKTLAEIYRKELEGKITDFSQALMMDEIFTIEAKADVATKIKYESPDSSLGKVYSLKFSIRCQGSECQVAVVP